MIVLKSLMVIGFFYTLIFFHTILMEVKLTPDSGAVFEILLNGKPY
jgi:hypothetical protein